MNEARSKLCKSDGRKVLHSEHRENWQPPPKGWVKVNTDGAFSFSSPGVACGGVVRDEHCGFLTAFMFRGEEGDSLSAELWGCLHGLKIVWDMGFRNVILKTDSADAVALIRNLLIDTHEDRGLVEEIKGIVKREWTVDVQLIRRWANEVADKLAKAGLSSLPGVQIIPQADTVLERLLERDKV